MESLIGLSTLVALVLLSILARLLPDDPAAKRKPSAKSHKKADPAKAGGGSSVPAVPVKNSHIDSRLRHVILGAIIGGSVSAIVSNLLMGRVSIAGISEYMQNVLLFFTR